MDAKAVLMVVIIAMTLFLGLAFGNKISCNQIQGSDFECAKNSDCRCDGKWLICKRKTCVPMTIKDFMERQPCFGVFKTNCTEDADCRCADGTKLMCEDNECVREKAIAAF
ncbi:uncharacterized protein LOC114574260 [Exaiptasia diaphana]|uniref:Uncharacterized protein n=1 Tax=Exaiptasia diaphana TaxID=2652724 RepID=A0A913YWX5_EXADI|nr:uncharacterized protein LOC114574260 [Exaiptasia diaphana]